MAPKKDRVYARGCSKSVTPCDRLVVESDDEHDPEYDPLGIDTPSRPARATRAMPKKLESDIVTASQSDKEQTLTGTPFGLTTHEEVASISLGVSWSEEASWSAEVPAPATTTQSASSNEADSPDSTPGSPTGALTQVADKHNRW